MSHEASSSAAPNKDIFAQLSAGDLVDNVEAQLKASNAIKGGQPSGLIHSLEHLRDGDISDGVGPYSPSSDKPRDYNVRASYANQQPMAWKHRGTLQPHTLHNLTETGDRFFGATGSHSLHGLSRLTLAMAGLAVENKSAKAKLTLVSEGYKSLEIDEAPFDTMMALRSYDKYQSGSGKTKSRASSALAAGLSELADFGPRAKSDACIVVSDFVMGAQRDDRGELVAFDWQKPLQILADTLGDRLYVVRLTTPAQTGLPYAREYTRDGQSRRVDTGDYLAMAENYHRLGQAKADRISTALVRLRHVELATVDRAPIVTAGDFIFGQPQDS